jgi:hypothetical protein
VYGGAEFRQYQVGKGEYFSCPDQVKDITAYIGKQVIANFDLLCTGVGVVTVNKNENNNNLIRIERAKGLDLPPVPQQICVERAMIKQQDLQFAWVREKHPSLFGGNQAPLFMVLKNSLICKRLDVDLPLSFDAYTRNVNERLRKTSTGASGLGEFEHPKRK